MKLYGKLADDARVKEIISYVDTDKDGKVNFAEYAAARLALMKDPKIVKGFKDLDTDNDGFITTTEMKAHLIKTNAKITNAEAAAKIKEADKNGDGKVSLEEFSLMMME